MLPRLENGVLPQNGFLQKTGANCRDRLGMRTTKAVSVQRRGRAAKLLRYTIRGRAHSRERVLARADGGTLEKRFRSVGLQDAEASDLVGVGGVQDTLVRHAEVPFVVNHMRLMLKFNSKNYLQQELPDYVFDCPTSSRPAPGPNPPLSLAKLPNARSWSGAQKAILDQIQAATKGAGPGGGASHAELDGDDERL